MKPTDTTPTTATPKGPLFGAALAFLQAAIGLILHVASGNPSEAVCIALASIMFTNGWWVAETITKRARRGRLGVVLAFIGANAIGAMSLASCAAFPPQRGATGEIRIMRDGAPPACAVALVVGGVVRDILHIDDCTDLVRDRRPPEP